MKTDARVRMRTPALAAWRRELARGVRTPTTFDALWRAACEDAAAFEVAATMPALAASNRRAARRIVAEAGL